MAPARQATVSRVEDLCPGARIVELELEGAPLSFDGGQYVILYTGVIGPGEQLAKRAYSILSADADGARIVLGVKLITPGPGSHFVHRLAVGQVVEFSGPWGKLRPADDDPPGPTLVLASDTGITAAIGLLRGRAFAARLPQTHLLWLAESADYFLPADWVRRQVPDELAGFDIGRVAPVGHVDRLEQARAELEQVYQARKPVLCYLVGDGDLTGPIQKDLMARGIPSAQLRNEFFFNNPKNKDPKDLRSGFTTGACSAAAAKAAARVLVGGALLTRIESTLPNGRKVTFALKRCETDGTRAICSVIKDAGDDPDCTHGAELTAIVELREQGGIELRGGDGVATVTKPGLGLEVGTSAINPVPRKNISAMVAEELVGAAGCGAIVTIEVPRGEEMALQTTNDRLGLIGGISILGTSGIVKPYSTAAFRTSIIQQIDVAANLGMQRLVFTTGGKTEQYAMEMFPELEKMAFVQVGDFVGAAMRHCAKRGVRRPMLVGMMGKMSKMGDGQTMTHAAGSQVNMRYLAGLAAEVGASAELVEQIEQANTARHVLELCQQAGMVQITSLISRDLVRNLNRFAGAEVQIEAYMVDFNGNLLGQHPPGESADE